MVNLLDETLMVLKGLDKTIEDISWIGSTKTKEVCSWNKFAEMANFKYDNGYGSQEVRDDLVIVFNDGSFLHRREYDGSEWWEHIKTPERPEKFSTLLSVFHDDANPYPFVAGD